MINVISILKDSDHKCLLVEGSGGQFMNGTLKWEDFIEKMNLSKDSKGVTHPGSIGRVFQQC